MLAFDLILFDLDGTLVDSAPDLASALDAALGELHLPPVGPVRIRGLIGDGVTKLCERALPPGAAVELPALVARFRDQYARRLVDATRPYDGIPEVLAALATCARPPRLVVVTNKPGDAARTILGVLGLAPRFAAVIGDGDGHPRKPDPTAALELVRQAGTTFERALVVGDGVPDLEMARAAALPAAAALWGYAPRLQLGAYHPRWMVDKPMDLLDILDV